MGDGEDFTRDNERYSGIVESEGARLGGGVTMVEVVEEFERRCCRCGGREEAFWLGSCNGWMCERGTGRVCVVLESGKSVSRRSS